MLLSCWLKTWRRLAPTFRRHSPRRGRPNYGPPLEALECRVLLTAYNAATAAQLVADINAANQSGGANTITLTAPVTSPYILTAGTPVISGAFKKIAADNLTIVGNGDTIERSSASGTPHFGLFDVAAASKAGSGGSLTLENLTLQNGAANGNGGAVFNRGTLVLNQVTVQDNTAEAFVAAGGGIWSSGSLTVENSTIQGNVANFGNWSEPAFGGGIYIAGGTANITGSIFSGNAAEGSTAYGGAVYIAGGTVTLSGDTLGAVTPTYSVPGNSAEGSGEPGNNGYGGAIYVAAGSVTLTNDIIEGNAAGTPVDLQYIDGYGGGIFIATGATVYIDSFTVAYTNSNADGSGVNLNIDGKYLLLA